MRNAEKSREADTKSAPLRSNGLSSDSTGSTRAFFVRSPKTRSPLGIESEAALFSLSQYLCQFLWLVDQHIRRRVFERMRRPTIGDDDGIGAGIACRNDVYIRIADNDRLLRISA